MSVVVKFQPKQVPKLLGALARRRKRVGAVLRLKLKYHRHEVGGF